MEVIRMGQGIENAIAQAYAQESKAASRNQAFVLKAVQEGYPKLALIFKAVAEAKSVHARRFHFLMRGKIGTTEENLKSALAQDHKALEESYPKMVEEARKGSAAVKKAFIQSMKTNRELVELYKTCIRNMENRPAADYYVCQICGHIHKDRVPERCPVCRAVAGRFKKVA
jgi:rubrerythrin